MDLVDVTILMSECTFGSMNAVFDCEERFAVLIASPSLFFNFLSCLVSSKFFVIVGESAAFAIATAPVLDYILAKFGLVLRRAISDFSVVVLG